MRFTSKTIGYASTSARGLSDPYIKVFILMITDRWLSNSLISTDYMQNIKIKRFDKKSRNILALNKFC